MSNKNALIAMAHVSENSNNPYYIYGEYIKYCVFTNSDDYLFVNNLKKIVQEEFGIYIPHNVFSYCLSIICNEGIIEQKNNQVHRIGEFDVEGFERTRNEYQRIEKSLIDDLVTYVAKYGIIWDFETARRELIKILDCNGLAYEIFIHEKDVSEETINDSLELQIESDEDFSEEDDEIESQPLYSNSFYVGRFISQLLNTNSASKEYLKKICEGLMISIGANQLSSDNNRAKPQIKGTKFFFDTRLLLRYVGCAGEAAVNASRELVEMIQKAGGVIYYFPQTLSEMNHALDDAIRYKQNKTVFLDYEMRLYAKDKSPSVITAKKANLENELSRKHIYLKPLGNYSEKDRVRFGFDFDDWKQFLISNLNWDSKTIENDALSIWETHMDRQGNYTDYCGTNKRLSVFVTNNSRLVGVSLKFKENRSGINNISEWKSNRLPVITDVRLTCRLWSPSEQCERMALLYLTSNAVAAQRPTKRYVNEMRKLVSQLSEEVPEYDNICLSEFFDDNVTELFLEKNQGDLEKFNVGNLASSLKELTEYRAIEEQKRTEEVKKELKNTKNSLSISDEKLKNEIKGIKENAINANTNTLSFFSKVILFLILHWTFLAGAIVAIITALVYFILEECNIVGLVFTVLAAFLLFTLEQIFLSKRIQNGLYSFCSPKIKKRYEEKINKNLRDNEQPYKEEIINSAIENTELIKKCKSKIK